MKQISIFGIIKIHFSIVGFQQFLLLNYSRPLIAQLETTYAKEKGCIT